MRPAPWPVDGSCRHPERYRRSCRNPAADPLISHRFSADRLASRVDNKAALQHRFELDEEADAPLFGVVSRLSWQKGLDLLLDLLPLLMVAGAQLVVLDTGGAGLEAVFAKAAGIIPGG